MICDYCGVPGYIETKSGVCNSCAKAIREQETKRGHMSLKNELLSLREEIQKAVELDDPEAIRRFVDKLQEQGWSDKQIYEFAYESTHTHLEDSSE